MKTTTISPTTRDTTKKATEVSKKKVKVLRKEAKTTKKSEPSGPSIAPSPKSSITSLTSLTTLPDDCIIALDTDKEDEIVITKPAEPTESRPVPSSDPRPISDSDSRSVSVPDSRPVPFSSDLNSNSDSDSSSDSDSFVPLHKIHTRHHYDSHMMPQLATVEDANPKIAPTLMPGKITPEILHRWEKSCKEYFRIKNIAESKKVESILSRLQDLRIADWAEANETILKVLEFSEFMDRLKERALEKDWDRKIKLSMLWSKQGGRPFHEWAYELQTRNALLRGRPCHFSEEALREVLQNGMDQSLELRIRRLEEASLYEWIEAVRLEDEFVTREREMYRREQGGPRSITNARVMGTRIENTAPTTQRQVTNSAVLPKLTPAERAIIFDHQGCFKCRRLYVDHKGANCPNGFPAPGSYKALTPEYAEAVRDGRNKPRRGGTMAAHIGHASGNEDATPSAVLGVGEGESDDSNEYVPRSSGSFSSGHLEWRCQIDGPSMSKPLVITALIDNGSHSVLIDETLVARLGLRRRRLPSPQRVRLAMGEEVVEFSEWVKLQASSIDGQWTARVVRAIVAPGLAYPVILGGPFLESNKIVIDHEFGRVTTKDPHYQLLPAEEVAAAAKTLTVLPHRREETKPGKVLQELKDKTRATKVRLDKTASTSTSLQHFEKTLKDRISILSVWDELTKYDLDIRGEFRDWFPEEIPHVTRLQDDVFHRFCLKGPEKVIKCCSYACPKKYRDAWKQLLDQHLAAERIRESSSKYCSPSFLIPKADLTVLLRWVNDYWALNDNTVPNHYPLPRIKTILSNCAKGSIWAKIDMMNSFFQTRVHPDDVKFMAVMTPFSLYKWVVMPMGCKNAPATHQRQMNQALCKYIGKICHVYLDDIIIWLSSIEEHQRNVRTILQALREADLYCSRKKSQLFTAELDFLGHHISARGIEPDQRKVEKIQNWLVLRCAKDICKFLGLVQYLASFLPRLAEHRCVLTKLTTKEVQKDWPGWDVAHQWAFQNIKDIVLSSECLMTIDHDNMDGWKIFVTCDASNRRTGACLSFGKTWEVARPVAWDSVQLSQAEKNYPTHEKEMLAIVRALKKFRPELLGTEFTVYTDHQTLECFQGQRKLS